MKTCNSLKKALLPALLAVSCAGASASEFGLSLRGGTLGAGLEIDYVLSDHFSLRVQGNSFSYDDDFEEDGINYSGELDLSSAGAMIDWHVFGGSFRLSAGLYSNGNELVGLATGEGEYEIGDRVYTSDLDDPVRADISVELGKSTAPYVGFGWGNSPKNKGGFMFSLDMGVIAAGSPDVELTVSGTAIDNQTGFTVDMASNPQVQAEVAKEVAALEDDISDFELYPVIMLGIGYRF